MGDDDEFKLDVPAATQLCAERTGEKVSSDKKPVIARLQFPKPSVYIPRTWKYGQFHIVELNGFSGGDTIIQAEIWSRG